ncbi:uncharacterized protein UHOD_20440 [Ustilago sp. UG-2017b]|nr:uncharacterized protein UHOD_20440 [Ustilago sp. UG-2017b]
MLVGCLSARILTETCTEFSASLPRLSGLCLSVATKLPIRSPDMKPLGQSGNVVVGQRIPIDVVSMPSEPLGDEERQGILKETTETECNVDAGNPRHARLCDVTPGGRLTTDLMPLATWEGREMKTYDGSWETVVQDTLCKTAHRSAKKRITNVANNDSVPVIKRGCARRCVQTHEPPLDYGGVQ